MNENFLTVKDAARMLNRSSQTVRFYTNSGKLPAIRTPTGMRLFRESDVQAFALTLNENQTQPRQQETI